MSEATSALGGAGFDAGIATVAEAPLQGMITLRGDLSASAFATALSGVTGLSLPAPRRTVSREAQSLCWMSPDEVLFLCPYADRHAQVAALEAALEGQHALVANVSEARAVFTLQGAHARDVLAKLCPVDLAPASFGAGDFRRTRLAQSAAAFWMPSDNAFHIVCFRSHARYIFDVLCVAAQPGSEVHNLALKS
ncbi:MAG: sarcosine oxidase subunit gamma family protein [Pseudomonadota bacterium]